MSASSESSSHGIEVVDAEWGIHPYGGARSWEVDETGYLRIYEGDDDLSAEDDNCLAVWAPGSWRAAFGSGEERQPDEVKPDAVDPEPVWQPYDVVVAADGRVWRRGESPQWLGLGGISPVPHDRPARPLTLIVRNGKAVVQP